MGPTCLLIRLSFFIISYFYRRSEAPSSELESAGQLFVKICKSQAVAVLSVAAFGYPTFTAEDDVVDVEAFRRRLRVTHLAQIVVDL